MDIQAYLQSYLSAYTPYKTYWNYEDGCVLSGCIALYRATGDSRCRDFVLRYLESRVTPAGGIPSYEDAQYNIDSINCGKALFFAYEQTGDARYRQAIEYVMERLRAHPRCACRSFWHKSIYPNQIWLDGLYMAQPFYMEYEMKFGGKANVSDIVSQFKNVRELMYNAEKGLYYHAYDETLTQPWASPRTGCSPNFWLRSMGWYLMALCDCLSLIDEQLFEHYKALESLFKEAVRGLARYRSKKTGLFFQVIDRAAEPGNYAETSGSAMIAYALLKGARIGVLNDEHYTPLGCDIFESLVREKLRVVEGKPALTDICQVAGLGPGAQRDGSVAYYLSEPRVADDAKGVGPFMMAYAEYLACKETAIGG